MRKLLQFLIKRVRDRFTRDAACDRPDQDNQHFLGLAMMACCQNS